MHPQWPPLRKQRPRGMRCSRWNAPNSRKNSVGVLAAGSASSARCGKSRSFEGRRSRAFQIGLGHAQRSSIIARWFEDRLWYLNQPPGGVPSGPLSQRKAPLLRRLCENWGESDREGRIDNDAAFSMSYIRGEDREQASFLPARIDDYVGAEAAVRVIDAFAEGLDVVGLGFVRAVPAATGRPGYDPRKRDPRSPESLVSAQPAGVRLLEPSRRNLVISGAFASETERRKF